MTSFARPVSLVALMLVGCGASSAAVATTAPDQAHLGQQVSDPRTPDPTATQAAPLPPASAAVSPPIASAPTGSTRKPAIPGDAPPPGETANASKPAVTEAEPPSRISARHVLVQWMGCDRASKSVLRTREQALVLIQDVQRRAKAGEDLGRLAVEYSDEPNAGARGGSLGRFSRGQMVGAFETAVFKLKVGELSDIVETPFGFHIIQRTE